MAQPVLGEQVTVDDGVAEGVEWHEVAGSVCLLVAGGQQVYEIWVIGESAVPRVDFGYRQDIGFSGYRQRGSLVSPVAPHVDRDGVRADGAA